MDLESNTGFGTAIKIFLFRLVLPGLLAVAPVSCAVTEPEPEVVSFSTSIDIGTAWSAYAQRDFSAAMEAFDQVKQSENSNSDQQRQAVLGKALVYLSTDPDWRDLEQAKAAVQTASDIADGSELQSAGVNFFGSSLEGQLHAESDNTELKTKVNELLRELEQAKSSLAGLEAENKALRAEQANLNAALDKLKELTLGN